MARVAIAAACAALLAACVFNWDGYDPRKAKTSTLTGIGSPVPDKDEEEP